MHVNDSGHSYSINRSLSILAIVKKCLLYHCPCSIISCLDSLLIHDINVVELLRVEIMSVIFLRVGFQAFTTFFKFWVLQHFQINLIFTFAKLLLTRTKIRSEHIVTIAQL